MLPLVAGSVGDERQQTGMANLDDRFEATSSAA